MSTSTADVEVRTETAQCRMGCGTTLERTVLYRPDPITGDMVAGMRLPVTCEPCQAVDEQPLGAPPVPTTPEDWLASLGVNTRKHGHATIENFDAGDAPSAPKHALRFVEDVTAAGPHDRVRGLFLVSEQTGTGKSHLAVAIMRVVHAERPDISVVFEPADRLVTRVQDSYGSGTTDELIERRARAGLYVLDDLGREKPTNDALRVLCTILDEREGAPTVITSNDLPRSLGARHNDGAMWARVASRLGDEVYRYVAVDGRDRRFVA